MEFEQLQQIGMNMKTINKIKDLRLSNLMDPQSSGFLNIICKINEIGSLIQNEKFGFDVVQVGVTEAKTNKKFNIQMFNNLIGQVEVDHVYLFTNVTLNQKYPNEIKTWTNKTKIHNVTSQNFGEEISNLVKKLMQPHKPLNQTTAVSEKIQQIFLTPLLLTQSSKDEVYNILAKVMVVGPLQEKITQKGTTHILNIQVSDHTRQNVEIFLWDQFSQISWQVGQIYLFERLIFKSKYTELKSSFQTRITVKENIQDVIILSQVKKLEQYFIVNIQQQGTSESLISNVQQTQKRDFDIHKIIYLNLSEVFQRMSTSKTNMIYLTKAFFADVQVIGLKLQCSSCTGQYNNFEGQIQVICQDCKKNANLNVNIQAQISDANRTLTVTIGDRLLEFLKDQIQNVYSLYQIDKFLAIQTLNQTCQKEYLFKEFILKIKHNPLKEFNFSLLIQNIEHVNILENIEMSLCKLLN